MKTQISAQIVAHSINEQGDELISVMATFPRIILAEVNTHKMLSKNTSSSRAIPFSKMVETIQNDPFIPIAWQKEHKGMQGTEYITDKDKILLLEQNWLKGRDYALVTAKTGDLLGTTKQLCNRLLEPFMWTTMLITGPRSGWKNFFYLRCPSYTFHTDESEKDFVFRSKKDAINHFGVDETVEYPSGEVLLKDLYNIQWLQANTGQAEIHMMALAECIWDAYNESTPKLLKAGEWHIPMISDLESVKLSTDEQIKLSVGRAANTSYTVVGDGKKLTLEQAIKIHDKCRELNHSSVFEHCAIAMSNEEHNSYLKGKGEWWEHPFDSSLDKFVTNKNMQGWCNNFKGFIPYRYLVDNRVSI